MYCPKCGVENPDEAKFCGKCAARMASPGSASESSVSDGLKFGVVAGSVLMPILGIIMGLIYVNDPSAERQKAGKLWLWTSVCVIGAFCACAIIGGLFGQGNRY